MDGLHVNLTAKGKEYANVVYARHCTIKRFLTLHGVDEENAEKDACSMEHVISPQTVQMMEKYVSDCPQTK
jgi:Mn-dependent DtxR family transcriptional regulator